MSIADRLPRFDAASRDRWLAAANRALPPTVSVLLILAIAYQLARTTWLFLPGERFDNPPLVAAVSGPAPSAVMADLSSLGAWQPFGRVATESATPAAPPPQTVVDAPDTTLNLKLTGVVQRDENEKSEAFIASGNQDDKRYVVGETIEGASGATLHQVYHDRVILNRSGRLETLRLPEQVTPRPARAVARRAPQLQNAAQTTLRQAITSNASRLTDIIRLAPHVEGGQVVGFRVTPGREQATFAALGLESGDVVTEINGFVLDDASAGLQAFEALGESTMANVTVVRNGSPQVLVIDTSQLESLSENRQ